MATGSWTRGYTPAAPARARRAPPPGATACGPGLAGLRTADRARAQRGATRGHSPGSAASSPAQIADLLEEASKAEETEILGRVHADLDLEADVFEELDEALAARLFGTRTSTEIAAVLARMRAGDAADAVADLPQGRRKAVLDLLHPDSGSRSSR
jgi:hypothetical protein